MNLLTTHPLLLSVPKVVFTPFMCTAVQERAVNVSLNQLKFQLAAEDKAFAAKSKATSEAMKAEAEAVAKSGAEAEVSTNLYVQLWSLLGSLCTWRCE